MTNFLNAPKTPIVAMVMEETPDKIITKARKAIIDGADCIGIQIECIERTYRTEEHYQKIFEACAGKPLYLTSYRDRSNEGMTDEQCIDELLFASTIAKQYSNVLCDVMGDTYCASQYQITKDERALQKQKALVDHIHEMGCEVLISSHFQAFLPAEIVIDCAKGQAERGADIIKMISVAENEVQLVENLRILRELSNAIRKPYIFLASGHFCQFIREMSGVLGNCMYLTKTYENVDQLSVSCVRYFRDELRR